ncbi:hypothetical protein ACFO4O_02415 [Glaciecola siphonariae]|uniref:Uncharacterized protein n=1 Tax=Glaciecola siphonariae TaxID=521012 RepID=A0ABV9LR81_9ALTE
MAKSAKEQLNAEKQEKVVILDKDFAGVKAGKTLFVGTPKIINSYIKKIPFGETRTIMRLRNELARKWKADATCPVSTSIFIRIAAQAAIDELNQGKDISKVTPFWRLLTSEDKIAKKLSIDSKWIDAQRESELL